jgi:hypothetical protein
MIEIETPFRVQGSRFWVLGSGFRVLGSEVRGFWIPGSGFTVQRRRWLGKLPVKMIKKLCSFESAVFGLWERFLTAITQVIVAGGHSHQPLTST